MNIRDTLEKLSFCNTSLYLFTLLAGLIISSGCSNDTGPEGESPQTANYGEIAIGLTDAEGDFLSYAVDVVSIKLTHANGNRIETLPVSTRVDFAQYVDTTEFLTAARVPNGAYTRAAITLNYQNAQILVENAEGNALEAMAVDESGNRLQRKEMEIQFNDNNPFVIAPGLLSHITLDFDLSASHQLDFSQAPPKVQVAPVLIADTKLDNPKTHRLRGLLDTVNLEASTFNVHIRPFYRLTGEYGNLRVYSDTDTHYEINGIAYIAAAGLGQLAQLSADTPLIVHGKLDIQKQRFIADHVLAGSSVPWGDKDAISGHVLAREGDTLILRGSVLLDGRDDHHDIEYRNSIRILVGEHTHVTKLDRNHGKYDKNDISVGQKIDVQGHFNNEVLDATAGHVRLLPTAVNGNILQLSPLVIDLHTIGRHSVTHFDFSGTGNMEDANPDYYEIDTGELALDGFEINARIRLLGFSNRFGEAPPDFTAHTAINTRDLPAFMRLQWNGNGDSTPFISRSDSALVIDLNSDLLGEQHHIFNAGHLTDLLTLSTAPTLQARPEGKGIFIIIGTGSTEVFEQFSIFEHALTERLDGLTGVTALHGIGSFDASTATLAARIIIIKLSSAG